jgi:hypothetical protein
MDLQNTGDGTVLRFSGMEAKADTFAATGEGTIFMRRIDAHGTLDLVHGLIGVPFTIRGTTQKPRISVLGGKSPPVAAPVAAPLATPVAPTPADPARERPAGVRDES